MVRALDPVQQIVGQERLTPGLECAAAGISLKRFAERPEFGAAFLGLPGHRIAPHQERERRQHVLPEIDRFRQDHRVGQDQPLHEVRPLARHQQGHAAAHRMPAEDHALRRFLFQPFDHIIPVAFPGFHPSRLGQQGRASMPAQV